MLTITPELSAKGAGRPAERAGDCSKAMAGLAHKHQGDTVLDAQVRIVTWHDNSLH